MLHFSHILFSNDTGQYTNLNKYNKNLKRFEGEYSLIHNLYDLNSFLLHQFLKDHIGKELKLINSTEEEYSKVSHYYERFLEEDISNYIENNKQKEEEEQKSIDMDKNLGQLQLFIVKGMLEEEIKAIRNQKGEDIEEHKFLLGKQIGLEYALRQLEEILEKGNNFN